MIHDPCPSAEDLLDPLPNEAERVHRHLQECPRCRTLSSLAQEGALPELQRPSSADIPPLEMSGRRPPTMPDRVRTGDIWQVVSPARDERYVVVIAGLAEECFTVAGTSPDIEHAGPGDVVLNDQARATGYELMLCTWSSAGVPEQQFEQFLGRIQQPARRSLVKAHRRGQSRFGIADGFPTRALDRGRVSRAAFRSRLQGRLERGLISIEPSLAQLPIPTDVLPAPQAPGQFSALLRAEGGPDPATVARVLGLDRVGWLPSTKRYVKWLYRELDERVAERNANEVGRILTR